MSDSIVEGRKKEVGGVPVVRAIPTKNARHVGPFVFLDRFGPSVIDGEHAMDTKPHPHIGLSTVTYFVSGRAHHRDSIGSSQIIEPGDLNVMKAGKGIAHSERTPKEDRVIPGRYSAYGLQFWMALPVEHEESDPSFDHYAKDSLPTVTVAEKMKGRLLIGEFGEAASPVRVHSRTLFLEIIGAADSSVELSFAEEEIGVFLLSGEVRANGTLLSDQNLIVVEDPKKVRIEAKAGSRFAVIGGDVFPEKRYIWWNFVSSKVTRIQEAARAWQAQEFPKIPGETEFTPLPDDSFVRLVE